MPIIALSLAPVAARFLKRLALQARVWQFLFTGVALLTLAIPAWNVRLELVNKDSRIN